MNDVKSEYNHLVSLTQLFILREYPVKQQKIVAAPDSYAFFRRLPSFQPAAAKPAATKPSQPRQATIPPSINPEPVKPEPDIPQPERPPESPGLPPQTPPKPLPPIEPPPRPIQPDPEPSIPDPRLPDKKDAKAAKSMQTFQLDKLPAAPLQDLSNFFQLWKELFSHYPLQEQVPSDSVAQKIKNAWKISQSIPPVVILSFQDQDKPLRLLKNIAKAISLYGIPANVLSAHKIEQENKWDTLFSAPHLRLVIASDYGLYLLPGLMKYYKAPTQGAKHLLHRTPLLLLSDLSLYLQQPQLKPLLWRAICTELQAS